jgi:two-component system sensor histidine kinase KdpD
VKIRRLLGYGASIGLVAAATGIGELLGADVAVAALLLVVAVLLSALLGFGPGALAAVLGFSSLNWFFTPPVHTFAIENSDDLVAAVAFLLTAVLIGTVIKRLGDLRRRAEQRAHEAQLRLDLTNRLAGGEDPIAVAQGAADAIAGLFDLTACTVSIGAVSASARGPADDPGGRPVHMQVGEITVEATGPRRPLASDDRAVFEALVAALAAAYSQVQLERETREARIAIHVGQSRAGLLSAVSHNLRTPLASIRAAASTLRAPDVKLDPTDRRELLDTIVEETERLERLVTKTLDLGRIRAGGLEPELQEVDLGDLAASAVRRLRPLARAHRVRLKIDPDLPPVAVDVAMMEQVFLSLLENSLRFAPPGSEILVTAARSDDPSGAVVEVRVADHGPGVPADSRDRIFEEFVRVDPRPDSSGTGLGLAIVRALIAAHGGSVWVEDTPGGGATFAFRLPQEVATA